MENNNKETPSLSMIERLKQHLASMSQEEFVKEWAEIEAMGFGGPGVVAPENKSVKEVYIVECSAGSWDDYRWWVGGIFESQEDADNYAHALNSENERLLKAECPFKEPVEDMDLTEEEDEQYYRWWNEHNNAKEWNGAKVKQYSINTPIIVN